MSDFDSIVPVIPVTAHVLHQGSTEELSRTWIGAELSKFSTYKAKAHWVCFGYRFEGMLYGMRMFALFFWPPPTRGPQEG